MTYSGSGLAREAVFWLMVGYPLLVVALWFFESNEFGWPIGVPGLVLGGLISWSPVVVLPYVWVSMGRGWLGRLDRRVLGKVLVRWVGFSMVHGALVYLMWFVKMGVVAVVG